LKKNPINTIAITYNLKKNPRQFFDDSFEEYDEKDTVEAIKSEILKCGYKVILIEQDDNFLKNIIKIRPEFIFNIAEGRGIYRSREAQIPSILESLHIPYSCSDPLALSVTLDKFICNNLLKSKNIPVPLMYTVKSKSALNSLKNIFNHKRFFIIKPRWEGSSKGIFIDSLVSDFKDLKKKTEIIFYKYNQPAVIEEFLERDEITVGVLGNDQPKVITMMRILPKKKRGLFLYSLEVKRRWQEEVQYQPRQNIPKRIQKLLCGYALRAFSFLGLRDIARIDFRLDKDNRPCIIDINPLPGLSPSYSDLPIGYRLNGGTYSNLIKGILKAALKRYGLAFKN